MTTDDALSQALAAAEEQAAVCSDLKENHGIGVVNALFLAHMIVRHGYDHAGALGVDITDLRATHRADPHHDHSHGW